MSSMPLQHQLQQLRHAAWEDDLNVIKDLLQSIEDEGSASDSSEASSMTDGAGCHFPETTQQQQQFSFGPLHCAASMGNVEMLNSILAANVCDVDEVDKDGKTALMWAVSYACTSAPPASGGAPTPASSYEPDFFNAGSALAKKRTELELVEALIDHGANVNKPNFEGETPLFAAVKLGCAEKVAFLLENGADPNAKDINGATCLHHAAALGMDAIVAILLRNGAFFNERDEWDECALHWAVREGGESAMRIVKLLAEHGAVLDIYNDDDETPLDLAMEIGDDRMVQLLLSLGAMGSGFDSMSIADDYDDDHVAYFGELPHHAPFATTAAPASSFEDKAAPGLLAWSDQARQVMRACEQSLTHLVA
jgi:ankyrin repeat protein